MATQQRNIREKLVIFKRITHSIVVEIYQTCSDIAKTDAKSQKILNLMPKKKKFKNQKILNLELLKQQKKYMTTVTTHKRDIQEKDVVEICQIVLDNAKNKLKNLDETKELENSVLKNY